MTDYQTDSNSRLGQRMLWLAAIGLLAALYLFFSMLDNDGGMVSTIGPDGTAMVTLEADRGGHYVAEGEINGQAVKFLVDTGATDVALPASAARALGLNFGPRIKVMTAAGPADAWMTRLDEVAIGDIRRRNVRASITQGEFDGILLGMSFLQHYDLQQSGGRLVIRDSRGG